VRVEGVLASVTAFASSGSVAVRALAGSRVASPWPVRAGFGNGVLALPADASCRIEAVAGHGTERSELPFAVREETEPGALRAAVGAGGETIRLETGSGDVRIVASR
jgi:hypothetical protein